MLSGSFVSNILTRWEASIRLSSHGIGAKELNLKSYQNLSQSSSNHGLDGGFHHPTTKKGDLHVKS